MLRLINIVLQNQRVLFSHQIGDDASSLNRPLGSIQTGRVSVKMTA